MNSFVTHLWLRTLLRLTVCAFAVQGAVSASHSPQVPSNEVKTEIIKVQTTSKPSHGCHQAPAEAEYVVSASNSTTCCDGGCSMGCHTASALLHTIYLATFKSIVSSHSFSNKPSLIKRPQTLYRPPNFA